MGYISSIIYIYSSEKYTMVYFNFHSSICLFIIKRNLYYCLQKRCYIQRYTTKYKVLTFSDCSIILFRICCKCFIYFCFRKQSKCKYNVYNCIVSSCNYIYSFLSNFARTFTYKSINWIFIDINRYTMYICIIHILKK